MDNMNMSCDMSVLEGDGTRQLNSTVNDQLSSTAIGHAKVTRDDLKLSPILNEEMVSAYNRRLQLFASRGESPLTRKIDSKLHDAEESGYRSTRDREDKENSSSSPNRSTSIRVTNPFDSVLVDSLIHNTFSPSVFRPFKRISPESPAREFRWSIECQAQINPAKIGDDEIAASLMSPDPILEARAHQALELYWRNGTIYVPSPDVPPDATRPPPGVTPAPISAPPLAISATPSIQMANRLTVKKNRSCQTMVTIPANVDFDFEAILGSQCVHTEDEECEEEMEQNELNSSFSLRRRLFLEEEEEEQLESTHIDQEESSHSLLDPLSDSSPRRYSLHEDLGDSPSTHQIACAPPDFSPIKFEE